MQKKLICLIALVGLFGWGCITNTTPGPQTSASPLYGDANSTHNAIAREGNALVFNPNVEVESVLPRMQDLPVPEELHRPKTTRQYTGIIKNKTRYEVSVPSGNSGTTLVIPAHGWIEYPAWSKAFQLTAYHDGKPFYCMKIFAHPKAYPFMCKKYDFMVEIVKGKPRHKIKKRIRRHKRAPKDEGVKAFG